ncbi:serine/threonine protein kinase [Streptomyces sp. NPDC001165]|uniref:serine/threonine protein kinase n=1 Tax=Streptomyces sp. NPDC001165 TaxID=3364546 RepID=UPI0036B1DC62
MTASGVPLQIPSRLGSYTVLTALDGDALSTVAERRYIARSHDGNRTVVVALPPIGADHARWAAEATTARGLALPGLLPIAELDTSPTLPWYGAEYRPLLALPTVLGAHGGPLPDHTVRALGASLASSLALAHAQGVTHAGLSPEAVLLGMEGPRISCFGAARAAAPDGVARSGIPWLNPSCLAPEQASGGRPRPPGDVFALGAVLSYASTGHTVPEFGELPVSLRSPVSRCLSRDAAQRPQASHLAKELAGSTAAAPGATVLDVSAPVPLPGKVIAALARQSAALLAAEIRLDSRI